MPVVQCGKDSNLSKGKHCLETGGKMKQVDSSDNMQFISMVGTGPVEILRSLLLIKGVKANETDNSGHTVLMWAAKFGSSENVKVLLEAGAEINMTNNIGMTALMLAARQGNVENVRVLVGAGAEVNTKDYTPLMLAARQGYVEVVKVLLEVGAEVNATNKNGTTALMRAAGEGNVEVVRVLLRAGAEVNIADTSGETALGLAMHDYHTDVVNLLLGVGADVGTTCALCSAAAKGNVSEVNRLLSNGIDANQADSNSGETALMWAARYGRVKNVELLLRAGVAINMVNKNGETALMQATTKGHVEIVQMLLGAGAEVNAEDGSGDAVVSEAKSRQTIRIVWRSTREKERKRKRKELNVAKESKEATLKTTTKSGLSIVSKVKNGFKKALKEWYENL